MTDKTPNNGDLQVWWIPQIPGTPFTVNVPNAATAKLIISVLAGYDAFQLGQNIKPDHCNAGGVAQFKDGEWLDVSDDELEDLTP